MSEKKLSERIQEGLVLDLVSEIKALERRLAEAKDLLVDNYPCYGEDKCKNCKGDFGEIDYRTCIGYNSLKALRGEG
jgi:hypothetical protein